MASAAYNVSNVLISHWDTAYGRGNHASAGYLTASSLSNYVSLSITGNWDTAYGRGNHASA
ncbi:MAG: hypothetical protein WCH65_06540 [bacterium]